MTALRDRVLSIGAHPRDTADERFRKRLLVGVALIILPAGFVWGLLYWLVGEREVALTPWAYVTGSTISLVVFARTRSFAFLRTAQLLLILVAPALGTVMLGGLDESSSVILWSLLAPLGAVAFDRPGRAWPWFGAFVATIVLALALSEVVRPNGADLPDAFVRTFDFLNIVVVSFVAMLLLVTFARGREAAQARVEALLLNVLPAEVAQRLQSDPNSIADHFDDASILFADVVDFTPLASRLDAREVVELLDRLFTSSTSSSTATTSRRSRRSATATWSRRASPGSGRITHTPWRDSRSKCASARRTAFPKAPSMTCASASASAPGQSWPASSGVAVSCTTCGGDTVNMASRMESHGTPDDIQITRSTWELLRDDFVAEPLGLVDVKGKGVVETWRLLGPREDLAVIVADLRDLTPAG
jgi:adenylate cyclase